MKKNIWLITILLGMFQSLHLSALDLRFLSYNWNNYDNYNRYDSKPKLDQRKKLTRTKWTILGSDTIGKIIDLEVISYHDRYIIQDYEDDGTVDERTTVVFVDSNKIIKIWEYIDESNFDIDSMFMTYDSKGRLLECVSKSYSFDTLNKYSKLLYYYNELGYTSRIEKTDALNNLISLDSFFYNKKGNREKINRYKPANRLYIYTIYERNKWVNDKLYQVIDYNSDGTISNRTIVPSNPAYPDNVCVLKRYSKPSIRYLPSVSTTIIEKTEINTNGIGYTIKKDYFEDHEFKGSTVLTYDLFDRIIEEKSMYDLDSEKVRRSVYQYTTIHY